MHTPAVVEAEILTSSGAARLIGVSLDTLRLWTRAGRIPHVRTDNGMALYRRDELEPIARERASRRKAARW